MGLLLSAKTKRGQLEPCVKKSEGSKRKVKCEVWFTESQIEDSPPPFPPNSFCDQCVQFKPNHQHTQNLVRKIFRRGLEISRRKSRRKMLEPKWFVLRKLLISQKGRTTCPHSFYCEIWSAHHEGPGVQDSRIAVLPHPHKSCRIEWNISIINAPAFNNYDLSQHNLATTPAKFSSTDSSFDDEFFLSSRFSALAKTSRSTLNLYRSSDGFR